MIIILRKIKIIRHLTTKVRLINYVLSELHKNRALLTGEIENIDNLGSDDFRRSLPRFQKENIKDNLKLLDAVKSITCDKSCTRAQVALAWVKSIGAITIPGTTKENSLLSNSQSLDINLTDDEIHLLSNIVSAKGYRYTEAAMRAYGFDDEI